MMIDLQTGGSMGQHLGLLLVAAVAQGAIMALLRVFTL
jgi:hypothetical protein